MRRIRYQTEKIIRMLQEVESGRAVKEECGEHGIASAMYCTCGEVNDGRRDGCERDSKAQGI